MSEGARSDFASSLDTLPGVSSFEWSSQTDCTRLSDRARSLLGVASPISTDQFFNRIHPDDRIRIEAETITFLETGGNRTEEFRFIRPDGKVVHLISHASLVRSHSSGHDLVSGIFIDVTEARENDRIGGMPECQLLGSYVYDVRHGESVWCPALRQLLLCPADGLITRETMRRHIHPSDRDWVTGSMDAITRRPGPYELSYRLVLPDGRTLWVRDAGRAHATREQATGKVDRVTGTLTDIVRQTTGPTSHLKLASDEFWRLIDTAPVGVYAVDADLRMVRINRTGMAAFSEIDDLIGRDIGEVLNILWDDPFASYAVTQFRKTLDTGTPYYAEPVIQDRADRKVLEAYDWSIERTILDDGEPGVLCYFYDLSERVRDERALEEQQKKLGLAYSAAQMGAWEVNLVTQEVSGTAQLAKLFGQPGYSGDMSQLWRNSIHPEDRRRVETAFEKAARRAGGLEVDFRILIGADEVRYLAAKGEVVRNDEGRALRVIGVIQDITAVKETEMSLRQSESQLRTVIDSTLAFVGVLGPDGRVAEINQPALDFGGLARGDVIGKKFWETPWWAYKDEIAEQCRQAVAKAQTGEPERFDVVVRGKGDQLITVDVLIMPIFDEDGRLVRLVASGFDVSAREEARAHATLLMGEINHRTKNILTLVQAVARQTARGGTEGFLDRFETRLRALSRAQDLLLDGGSDRIDLHSLAGSQLDHFRDLLDTRIHLSGPPIELSAQAAQAVGMALHELATNAGKYGALSNENGRVTVSWDVQPKTNSFDIRWAEHDGPTVSAPRSKGFGSTVIDQMTSSALNATVSLDYAPGGVRWHLTCALEALKQS
ncbi:PAS domain-containing protein [Roseovarius sp. S4756]|uniref:PAS domain-containing protein n=1 Tax=Roseovarius maritimus TaxID=3342637 RepID=UPI003729C0FA